MAATPLTLTAPDGHTLKAYAFTPAAPPTATVLMLPGMGIPQRFFGKMAAWLATQNFAALTLDYRGVAESAPEHLGKQHSFKATDWARHDIEAGIQWLTAQHPDVPLLVLAHSFGGQVLGLVPSWQRVKGVVMAGSGTGSQVNYPFATRMKHGVMWNILYPYYRRTRGYLPGSVMGGAHIPAAAVAQWKVWCHSKDYLFQHIGHSIPADWNHYEDLQVPIVSYYALDDKIVTEKGVRHLLSHYPNCEVEAHFWKPEQFGQPKVGHVAMFRDTFKDTWWPRVAEDLGRMAAAAK